MSTSHNAAEAPAQHPEVVLRLRRNLEQEPGYFKGLCCYCGTRVLVTHQRMKVGNDYCHHECAYDRECAGVCLVVYVRRALRVAKIAPQSE